MPKIDATASQATWTKALESQRDKKLAPEDKKLLAGLVERAELTDFTEIGSGRPVKPSDLKHAAAAAYDDVRKKHSKDEIHVRMWRVDESDKHSQEILVVAHESKKANLHVRFFADDGRQLKAKDGAALVPVALQFGAMYDGQD